MPRMPISSSKTNKKGLMEEYTGKIMLLVIFLIVAILIYAMLSGKSTRIGSGMQWLT